MPAMRHQSYVTVRNHLCHVDGTVRRAIGPVECHPWAVLVTANLEIVDLLEFVLDLRLLVVLVRRVRGPVTPRGENFAGQQPGGMHRVSNGVVHHLARAITRPTQLDTHLRGRAIPGLKVLTSEGVGQRHPSATDSSDGDCPVTGHEGIVGDLTPDSAAPGEIGSEPITLHCERPFQR